MANSSYNSRNLNIVTIIGVLIYLVFIGLGIVNKTYGWAFDSVVIMCIIILLRGLAKTFKLTAPVFALWIVLFCTHSAGTLGFYDHSPLPIQWDHITHISIIFAFTLMFYCFAKPVIARHSGASRAALIAGVLLLSLGIGALNETTDFLGYLKLGIGGGAFMFGPGDGFVGPDSTRTDMINIVGGGWENTGLDLFYNLFGALLGLGFMIIFSPLKSSQIKQDSARNSELITFSSTAIAILCLLFSVFSSGWNSTSSAVLFVVFILVAFLHKCIKLTELSFTALAIGVLMHLMGILGAYSIGFWSPLVHFLFFAAFAVIGWNFASKFGRVSFGIAILIFFGAIGFGAVAELVRFFSHLDPGTITIPWLIGSVGSPLERLLLTEAAWAAKTDGGWISMGWNFIWNLVGALAGVILMAVYSLFCQKK